MRVSKTRSCDTRRFDFFLSQKWLLAYYVVASSLGSGLGLRLDLCFLLIKRSLFSTLAGSCSGSTRVIVRHICCQAFHHHGFCGWSFFFLLNTWLHVVWPPPLVHLGFSSTLFPVQFSISDQYSIPSTWYPLNFLGQRNFDRPNISVEIASYAAECSRIYNLCMMPNRESANPLPCLVFIWRIRWWSRCKLCWSWLMLPQNTTVFISACSFHLEVSPWLRVATWTSPSRGSLLCPQMYR